MANDSSFGGANTFAFDLDSQKGIAHLLASVRVSDISPAEKNELRDLIFLYSNGGKDQSVRITLEQKIVFYGVVAVVSVPTPVSSPVMLFGASRPAPTTFSATAVTRQVVNPSPVSTVAYTSLPSTPVVPPTPTPVVPTSPQEVSIPVLSINPQDVQFPVEEVDLQKTVSVPVAEVITAPAVFIPPPVTPPVISEPVFMPQATVQPVPTQPVVESAPVVPVAQITTPPTPELISEVTNYDPGVFLQRIREIKSIVNDKVGNPVNLVDINNEVGREYMGALLDAMKKLNSGSSALSAMKRLETAFVEVKKTIEEYEKDSAIAVVSPTSVTSQMPVQPVVSQVVPITTTSPIEVAVLPVVNNNPIPFNVSDDVSISPEDRAPRVIDFGAPLSPVVETPNNLSSALTPVDSESNGIINSAWGPDTDTVKIAEVPVVNRIEKTVPVVPTSIEPPKVTPTITPVDSVTTIPATPASPSTKASSLAQLSTKPHTPADLPTSSAIETSSVAGNPLFTKEVDDGLQQLLVEWSLFKKSGLFGTGPKGSEHPLFKKLSPLQIPLLLAGRFEGVTQEIKQSITDYMNGWRYEQGIVYEPGEDFEHYLRRVIRHILDLQK